MRHFTPRREWAPLSDAEWAALAPYVLRAVGPGRLLADPRGRMDAILHIAVSGEPWRALPERFGKPGTISRHFRRLAHAGLWSRLLEALADPAAPPALRALEYWLCRAARRAMRLLGMAGLVLARRLGLLTALPMVPWMMPDPDLSESLRRYTCDLMRLWPRYWPRPGLLRLLGACSPPPAAAAPGRGASPRHDPGRAIWGLASPPLRVMLRRNRRRDVPAP